MVTPIYPHARAGQPLHARYCVCHAGHLVAKTTITAHGRRVTVLAPTRTTTIQRKLLFFVFVSFCICRIISNDWSPASLSILTYFKAK